MRSLLPSSWSRFLCTEFPSKIPSWPYTTSVAVVAGGGPELRRAVHFSCSNPSVAKTGEEIACTGGQKRFSTPCLNFRRGRGDPFSDFTRVAGAYCQAPTLHYEGWGTRGRGVDALPARAWIACCRFGDRICSFGRAALYSGHATTVDIGVYAEKEVIQ